MPLVPIDLDRLKSLAEDRGMSIPMLMQLLGVKRIGAKVEADLKARIWQLLEHKSHAVEIAKIPQAFPQAQVTCIRTIPE